MKTRLWIGIVIAVALLAIPFDLSAQGPAPSSPQIEKGRVAVTQVCVGCHGAGGGIQRMLDVREKSEQEWRETVYRMIGRGAQIFPDEIEPITAYLVSSTGRRRTAASPAARGGAATRDANAVLADRCQRCHDLTRATTPPATGDWSAALDRMVTLGATLSAAERQTLLDYFSALKK
jgi:mono/diheme cytochrome c family protein